jgi:hypothetical protein
MAVECASRGWDLYLTDMVDARLANLADSLCSAWNVSVEYGCCDLADANARKALFNDLKNRGISLHMAINVAGLDYEGMFLAKSREQILNLLNVNVMSTVDMMHSLAAFRDRTRTFRVINVCSLAGMFPMPVKATYAASKRLLIDMSLALREEYKAINGTVTALCPAGMATNEELLKSMDVQGFGGRITTLEITTIVRKTIDAALRGKAIIIPGIINRILFALSRLFPSPFVARVIGKRWKKTNRALERINANAELGSAGEEEAVQVSGSCKVDRML